MYIAELDLFYSMAVALLGLLSLMLFVLFRTGKRATRLRWPLLVVWNTALFLFLFYLAFMGGETWYRFFVDRTDVTGFMRIAKRWQDRHYELNEQGWRDNINYHLEPRAVRRITLLGDSFTAGAGIKDVEDRFSNILRRQLSDTEIHALARIGFDSSDHLKTIKYLDELKYHTDATLLIYMMNDISFCMPSTQALYHRMRQYSQTLSYPQRESYFLNMLSYYWETITAPDYGNYFNRMRDAYRGTSWEQNAAALREIRQRIAARGIPLLVVTFPFMQDLKRYDFVEEHQQLDSLWKAEGVPHLDLLPLLREHAHEMLVVNKWDAHPNEYVNKLAAAAIRAFLVSEGLAARAGGPRTP